MSKKTGFLPIKQSSLALHVFDSVREGIFSGHFQPGEPLKEMHLAEQFEVSQATVREALVKLEQIGLVVRTLNRKSAVTSFTTGEVGERMAMRVVLEELAFVLAAKQMKPAAIRELESLGRSIESSIECDDYHAMAMADLKFHQFVWQQSQSPVLARTLEQLTTPLFAFLSVIHQRGLFDMRSAQPHEELVEALRSGDEKAVREAIRRHINGSYGAA